jgi:hypothetical protein
MRVLSYCLEHQVTANVSQMGQPAVIKKEEPMVKQEPTSSYEATLPSIRPSITDPHDDDVVVVENPFACQENRNDGGPPKEGSRGNPLVIEDDSEVVNGGAQKRGSRNIVPVVDQDGKAIEEDAGAAIDDVEDQEEEEEQQPVQPRLRDSKGRFVKTR